MLKSNERIFSFSQKAADVSTIILSWILAYIIRFYLFPNAQVGLEFKFIKAGFILGGISLYFYTKNGLYVSQRLKSRSEEIFTILKSHTISTLVFIFVLYFFADERLSRTTLVIFYLLGLFFVTAERMSVRNFLRALRRRGKNLRHIILVGSGMPLVHYVHAIRSFKDAGINIIGWIDSKGKCDELNINEIKLDIETARMQHSPDSFVVSYTGEDAYKVDEILKNHHNEVTPIQILPDLTYAFVGYDVTDFAGLPIITLNQPNFSSTDLFLKRMFDFSLCFVGLLLISPLLIILAILVKVTSPGPIFFGQERIGVDGVKFKMWKFRSMKVATDPTVHMGWTVKDDPRRTAFGTFIRKTSLDELPQLWNVLVGDMSLVGPRPEQPHFVEKFKSEIPAYMLRHKMKAGITGWAQVNGWRGDTSLHKRIECDLYYIKNWSLWLDIKIIFLTFWKGFINKNAY